jgi:predicted RNA-binding protein
VAHITSHRPGAVQAAVRKAGRRRFWIAVACREHVKRGEAAGFCQVCHGKQRPLQRMNPGDWLIYYSSVAVFGDATPCQRFTAIGQVTGEDVYQVRMHEGFDPFRRKVTFQPCTEIPVKPLIDRLSFIKNKQRWGFMFRFGLFEIPKEDFDVIRQRMLPAGR